MKSPYDHNLLYITPGSRATATIQSTLQTNSNQGRRNLCLVVGRSGHGIRSVQSEYTWRNTMIWQLCDEFMGVSMVLFNFDCFSSLNNKSLYSQPCPYATVKMPSGRLQPVWEHSHAISRILRACPLVRKTGQARPTGGDDKMVQYIRIVINSPNCRIP